MSIRSGEYGSRGIVGVGVPPANPTVEQEMFALRPAGLSLVTARLSSQHPDPEQRIRQYFERTVQCAQQFDDLGIDALGVACTGSSYLVGADAEQQMLAAFETELGYPVLSAAQAIRATLARLNARRISVVAPYPEWLTAAAAHYWSDLGIDVCDMLTVPVSGPNIHAIYQLRSWDALACARQLKRENIDALLLSGTGMPTLGAINALQAETGLPVLTSNRCLLSELARLTGALDEAGPMMLPVSAGLSVGTL